MTRKNGTYWQVSPTYGDDRQGSVKICDQLDCQAVAEHRAPKSRAAIRQYFWFCLEHVRNYNAAWNYYAGMSEDQVEQELQKDTFWHRPTWPLGDRRSTVGHGQVDDPFGVFDNGPGGAAKGARSGSNGAAHHGQGHDKSGQEEYMPFPYAYTERQTEALAVMDLVPPVTVPALKSRYKELVKRHHPDANGGSRLAEERLKTINLAYGALMLSFED